MENGDHRPKSGRWLVLLAVVASSLAGLIVFGIARLDPDPVEIEELWLEGPEHGAPTRVELGTGAHLDLLAGARSRVQRETSRQNRVTLEGGALEVFVSEAGRERWSFYAGPYLVTTDRSEFHFAYHPETATIRLEVRSGRLAISGGRWGNDSFALDAGQRLVAGADSVTVGRLGATAAASSAQ